MQKKGTKKDNLDVDGNHLSHDVSVNVSETNESILEMKKITTIPVLKDIDKLTSKATKENSNLFNKNV